MSSMHKTSMDTRSKGMHSLRLCFIGALCVCAAAGLEHHSHGAEASKDKTNIVLILADDLGFSDLGCYGSEIPTPNIDRLAAGGLRFTQAYNTARCWPSRAALLTGYYPQAIRRDALPNGSGGSGGTRPGWARLLPEMLRLKGYKTYHSGKWHIDGDPLACGFDRSLDVTGKGQSNFFDSSGVTQEGVAIAPTENFYATRAIGEHAVACLADHAANHGENPFFQYVAFTAPHFPLHAPQELIQRNQKRYETGWNIMQQERHRQLTAAGIINCPLPSMELDIGPPYRFPDAIAILGAGEIERPLPWVELTRMQQNFQATKMAIHAAMIEAMDEQVGLILQQLAAMNALENTLIVFASDNGASAEIMVRGEGHSPTAAPGSRKTFLCLGPGWSSACNTPFRRHKTWVHEGGIATSFIAHWPQGISARGQLRHQAVHLIDVTPTVLEIAKIDSVEPWNNQPPPSMHGKSLLAAFADGRATLEEQLWWCHDGHRAVREGNWKLVACKGEPWSLYHLKNDRGEEHNLATHEPQRAKALEELWQKTADECRRLAATDVNAGQLNSKERP